jgi:alkanesulfonate monooxygenase SsuD/methylene tetrahydromethanopterin reductase-like flavin-dependent oxidoreductase (luciferase family)
VTDEAGTISKSIIFSTKSKIASFSPPITPRIPQKPIFTASSMRSIEIIAEANEGYCMIWSSDLRAAATAISVVDDSTDVMFYAFVYSHPNSNHTFAC